MTRRAALARARRGAAFLDAKYKTWRRKIRIDELDMTKSHYVRGECGCILAQIDAGRIAEGSYYDRQRKLGISDEDAVRFGFWVDGNEYAALQDGYAVLTAAWKSVLADA